MFTCPSLSDNYVIIALLSVRSIVSKIPDTDIEYDDSLRSAAILCFTETWLTHQQPQQPSPVLCDNQVVVRSDSVSGYNKGGVISMPHIMQTSDVTKFSFSGILIEAISTTLMLPNGEYLQLTVVYRSPSVSTDNLLNIMSVILSHLMGFDIPCIVLGNFNEDHFAKPDSRLVSLSPNIDSLS